MHSPNEYHIDVTETQEPRLVTVCNNQATGWETKES